MNDLVACIYGEEPEEPDELDEPTTDLPINLRHRLHLILSLNSAETRSSGISSIC